MPDMTDEEAIVLEMERQEAATEQDLLDRIANAFDRADKGAEVEAVWPVVEAELALRAGQAEAELDALKAEVEILRRDLNVWTNEVERLTKERDALQAATERFANILEGIAEGLESCCGEGAAHAPHALVRSMRRVLDHPTDTP